MGGQTPRKSACPTPEIRPYHHCHLWMVHNKHWAVKSLQGCKLKMITDQGCQRRISRRMNGGEYFGSDSEKSLRRRCQKHRTLCGHSHKSTAEGLVTRWGELQSTRRHPGAGLHHGSRALETTTLLVLFESGTRLSGSTTAITYCPVTDLA